MRGLKNKILIAFLIVISIVLGYQAYTMAANETFTKPAGASVPFSSNGMMIYCREHHNGWGFGPGYVNSAVNYKCFAEYDTESNDAYGLAYVFARGTKSEIQDWIWSKSGSYPGAYILNAGTDYKTLFETFDGFDKDFQESNDSNRQVTLEEALNDSTINIVDEVPYMFFTTIDRRAEQDDNSTDDEETNLITEISYEEYNYLYQVYYVFNYLHHNPGVDKTQLYQHIKNYWADGIGTVYSAETVNTSKLSIIEEKKNAYQEDIVIYAYDSANGLVNLWSYKSEETNRTYYLLDNDKSGTTKFNELIFFGEVEESAQKDILQLYINAFNKQNITELSGEFTKLAAQGKKVYTGLSNIIAARGVNESKEPYTVVGELYKKYQKQIKNIAENEDELIYTPVITNNANENYYELSEGSLAQNAAAYQWLMSTPTGGSQSRLMSYVNMFNLNSDNAKVAIDQDNEKYIIGPFIVDYATVVLNGETLVGLTNFDVKLNGNTLEDDEYKIINEDNTSIPKSGKEFYIELDKNIKGEDEKLNKEDEISVSANIHYIDYMKSTVHFLHAINPVTGEMEGDDPTKYSKSHPQRLMTADTEEKWLDDTLEDAVSTDYYNFEIIKVDKDNHETTLKGAVFGAYARYTSVSGSNIYLNLENQNSGFEAVQGDYNGENGIFSVLENVEGKYETDDAGKITFKNVPGTIVYNGTEYTLKSVVAKETEEPNGCVLDDRHIEIEKNANETATYTHENIVEKPYELTIKKVNEKGDPIPGVTFKYWYLNLEDDIFEASENEETSKRKTATTDDAGIATFSGKEQGELIALVVQEVEDKTTKELKYFQSMIILYSTKTDSQGNVEIEFFNTSKATDKQKELLEHNPWIGLELRDVKNGVYRIITKDNVELYGEDANEYIKCGEEANDGISIQDILIENETIKKYNLELFKYDENGNASSYLDGTTFDVTIAKENTSSYQSTVTIENGKATISNLDIYGENISIYLIEEPVDGFKTVLANPDEDPEYSPVIKYSAYDDGNVDITYINENLLNPEHIEKDDYKATDVVESEDGETISLQLGIINQTEEYSLKFRKVDENGEPLQGALFALIEKDAEGNEHELGRAGTLKDGYMTFNGLDKTGKVTLYLFELATKPGYDFSNATRENPIKLEYTYEPGSGKLTDIKITHVSYDESGKEIELEEIRKQDEILKTEDTENILFNFRELNEIWELVNRANPYDLELFTKVDEEGNPIANKKFQVSIYSLDESQNRIYAKYDNNGIEIEIKEVELTSGEDGKVILEKVLDYGKFEVEVKEIENTESETDNEHELLEDTLIFTYEIKKGETQPTWGDTLTVVNGETSTKYTKDDNSTKFKSEDGKLLYEYLEIDRDDLHLINKKKPYSLTLKKTNGFGTNLEDRQFAATIYVKNSSESQRIPEEGHYTTNSEGEKVFEGIKYYSTDENPIVLELTEYNIQPGYKWHEYGSITYVFEYYKNSFNAKITYVENSGKIIVTETGEVLEENLENPFVDDSTVAIENMPVYDLDLFDMKAIVTSGDLNDILEEMEKTGELAFVEDVLATSEIKFTAEVKDVNGNVLQSDVEVSHVDENEDGKYDKIVAYGIDTCSEFMNEDGTFKTEVTGLQLVLTEAQTNGLVKIDPITIIYDCTYNEDTGKFEPTKTGYKYQEQLKDFADKNAVIIDGLIYIDKDGNHVLVNTPKTAKLAFKKYDENGTPIDGITFEGKVYSVADETKFETFEVTTGYNDIPGLALIEDIELTGEIKIVIEDEYWENGEMPEGMDYSELEFIQDEITISGIVINVFEDGTRSLDYTNFESDNEKVRLNEKGVEIEVINEKLTYNIPIIKTTELLSDNEQAEKLKDVVFNFSIKEENEEDKDAQKFSSVKTNNDGIATIEGIEKFGENLELTIEEVKGHEDAKILEGKVFVTYDAEPDYDTNEVMITIKSIVYENNADAGNVKEIVDGENSKFLGINVVNPKDYSITLHKVMNINNTTEETTEMVTFKGIITTEQDIKINDKLISEFTYEEFKVISFDDVELPENVITFEKETEQIDGEMLVEIEGLDFYGKQVYVYFIERLQDNSTMQLIEKVMTVQYNQPIKGETVVTPLTDEEISVNTDNKLNIELTVENDATAYKFNILKTDEITGDPVSSLKNAKFEFVLNELEGNATISSDKATIVFADDGEIDEAKSTLGEKYIVGCELTDDGYIQLDINKFGDLQLIITEHTAPKHYITEKDPLVIKYTAKPGEIIVDENITSEKLTVTTSNDIFGLEVKLPNTPDSYDLPVYKLVTSGIDDPNAVATSANNIDFNVRFFDTEYNEIMQNWSGVYTVAGGQFVIKDINTFGEYYMTLEETDVPDNIIPLKGIHVFKITAKSEDDVDSNGFVINEDKVKSIEYLGTGIISDDGELTIEGNKEDSTYIKTEEKIGETYIARLEISNETVKQYSLDLLKYSENEENPLGNVKFDLYLTEGTESSYQAGDNLLKIENPYETGLDGKISIGELQLVGDYTFTIVERETKPGYTIPFDRIDISYSTEDGETIRVNSVKVYKDGREISSNNIVSCTPANASLQIKIDNPKLNDVPLNIHKVYYKDGSAEALPVDGATFTGTVTEKTPGATPIGFTATTENGYAHLGDFPVDGEVEVQITEIITPAGLDTIPPTTIYITVNNETKTIDTVNYTVDTNALEGIEGNNTFKIVDTQTTPPPTVSLAGIVWEDIKQYNKGEETYTDGENYTEGLYDAGYDKLVEGVIVKLYQKGMNNTPIRTYVTGVNGTYVFDELDPFEKYYVTFEYDGKNYEAVNYLVSDRQGTTSYGSIEKAIDKAYWDVNSKAVTNSDNENIATTTKTKEAIATNDRGNIQYYPAYNKFTIDNEGITLYIDAETKEYTMEVEGNTVVEFKPLHPSHNWINLGIIARPPFDLSLTKDVEQIKATLNTGASMTYLYGTKPQSSMYKLELSQADIKALSELEIVYRIEVINEDVAAGLLGSVADYYNSDLLTFKEAYYKVIPDGAEESEYDVNSTSTDWEAVNKIIPMQTYNSSESTLEKDNLAETNRVIIKNNSNTDILIPTGNKAIIFVKYTYNLEKLQPSLEAIGDEYVTLGVAEIFSSIAYINNENSENNDSNSNSGNNDLDSDAGNLVGKFNSLQNFYQNNGTYYTTLNKDIKEDDEDTAPAAKIVVGSSGKTISGNVFEDENGDNILNGKTEGNEFIPSEAMVNGVTVTLYNANGDKVEDEDIENPVKTKDGAYTFRNVPAGEYYITFTYGDENTVLPMLEKTNEDGTTTYVKDEIEIGGLKFLRANAKSYNTLEFENTGYTSPDSYTTDVKKSYWYTTSPERYSDAQDSEGRVEADLAISSKEEGTDLENSSTIGIMNNELAEKMNSYKADLYNDKYKTAKGYVAELAGYAVTAKTENFKLNFAFTFSEELQYNEEAKQGCIQYGDGTIQSEVYANNIDFGIKARPQSDISVVKEVENVKIISGGRTIVDVSYKDGEIIGQSSKVQWNKGTSNGKGYIWIQRAEEEIINATLEITYKITVANNAGEEIKVIVADYVQDGMTYSEAKNQNNGWQVVEANSVKENGVIKSSTVGNVKINNQIDLTAVSTVVTQEMEIKDADGDKTFENSTLITLTKQLNNYSQTDIDEYTNYVEVIQTESIGLARKDASSIFGNYDPVKQTTTEGNIGKVTTWTNGLEKDSAKALETLSITAETGENRQTYYILAFSVIAVFATGVILIKKKVLNK